MKLLKRRFRVTTLAFLLTLGAIAGPCLSWYFVGSRDVERRAAAEEEEKLSTAKMSATQLAERIRTRLELLREAEERRPFYHYQNLYHDPKGASEGASVVPSPLAQAPTDPFLHAYFQIDETGRLTVPTLNEDVFAMETNANNDEASQRALRRMLELAEPTIVSLLQQKHAQPPTKSAATSPLKVEQLSSAAWEQNRNANKLYENIRSTQAGKPAPRNLPQAVISDEATAVKILVGSFRWFTVPLRGEPTPVALREVKTPIGVRIQGFVIAPTAMIETLHGQAQMMPYNRNTPLRTGTVTQPIGDTGFAVVVDAADALAHTPALYQQMRSDFLRFFCGGVAAAIVAGLCVVGLVWQAERLARQRSQFAASAAHELRTPLAGMRMYSEMLAEGLGDPAKSKDYARRIADEVARLGRVVGNVLGFTRLERGTLAVRAKPGDLAAAVREGVARQQPTLEAAGAHLELAIAKNLPPVRFDPDAVAEILQNLLDNAEKHTRAATNRTIHISLDPSPVGRDTIPLVSDSDGRAINRTPAKRTEVILSITDHGPGISPELRRRLFRPFERGLNADAPAGLGLGLVLVQALTRAHGGQITCTNAPDRGAIFRVTFPL